MYLKLTNYQIYASKDVAKNEADTQQIFHSVNHVYNTKLLLLQIGK